MTVHELSPGLLTQKEAAAYLRVSVSWLRASDCPKVLLPQPMTPRASRRVEAGKPLRPLLRYRREDLDAWADHWRVA